MAAKIGFLNTMNDKEAGDPLLVAFKKALTAMGWTEGSGNNYTISQRSAGGAYKRGDNSTLEGLANQLVKDGVDLIVASGGLVAANAAKVATNSNSKPVLVCIGRLPTRDEDPIQDRPNIAGVSVDTPNQNKVRGEILDVDNNKTCLIYNANSKMGTKEANQWKKVHKDNAITVAYTKDTHTVADLKALFTEAKNKNAEALIISGDPFFGSEVSTIVAEVKKLGVPVCYPFRAFVNAHPGSVGYGPDLAQAYELLGYFAYLILEKGVKPRETIGILAMRPEQFS
jgi:ABC-type uncharacterized transport system substrate-binding protein